MKFSTIICIGGGPSLTADDVEACRGYRVIAINDAYRLAPWAQVLYAADGRWIDEWHAGVPSFKGLKFTVESREQTTRADWQVLRLTGPLGLELDPTGVRSGENSGYQAINLAVHLGAVRILLLGYDMAPAADSRTHWFGEHPVVPVVRPYARWRNAFESLVEPLAALRVEVVNCSRVSALTTFRRAALDVELARAECAV